MNPIQISPVAVPGATGKVAPEQAVLPGEAGVVSTGFPATGSPALIAGKPAAVPSPDVHGEAKQAQEFKNLLSEVSQHSQDQTQMGSSALKNAVNAKEEKKNLSQKLIAQKNTEKAVRKANIETQKLVPEQIESGAKSVSPQLAMVMAQMAPAMTAKAAHHVDASKINTEAQAAPVAMPSDQLRQANAMNSEANTIQVQNLAAQLAEMQRASGMPTENSVSSPQQNMAHAQTSQNMQHQAVQSPMMAMVMQPLVMPVAMPVEVLDAVVDSPEHNVMVKPEWMKAPEHQQLDHALPLSQDFIAERLNILNQMKADISKAAEVSVGKAHADPTLGNTLVESSELKKRSELSQHSLGSQQYIPQIGAGSAHLATHDLSASSKAPTHTSQQTPIQLANPASTASAVWGLAQRGGGTVKVKVTPEHLGELTISVKNDRGKLDVKLEAASEEAREILSASTKELKNQLTKANFKVDSLEVSGSSNHFASLKDVNGNFAMSSSGSSSSLLQMSGDSKSSGSSLDWNQSNSQHSMSQQDSGSQSGWERYQNQQDDVLNQYGEGSRQRQQRKAYEQYMLQA